MEEEFKLIGHDCPLAYYPSSVVPILRDQKNNLRAAYVNYETSKIDELVYLYQDVDFVLYGSNLHFNYYKDTSRKYLSEFDLRKHKIFAFSESKIIFYKFTEERDFFNEILEDGNFSVDNFFLRLSLAEVTNNVTKIRKELISCGQNLQADTPEFFPAWYQQKKAELSKLWNEQLKQDFPNNWEDMLKDKKVNLNVNNEISPERQIPMITTIGNYEFERYEKKDLETNHLMPQSLDNQWIPSYLLNQMKERNLSFSDIQNQVEQDKKMEFRRALINSRQLVINRAAIYNEKTVFECYENPGEDRQAFKAFLNSGTIVPFLFAEESPIQPPKFTTNTFEAWTQLCQEVRLKCLRLSWNDKKNKELIDLKLSRRFHEFCKGIASGDINQYIRDLNLPEAAEEPFIQRLFDLEQHCVDIYRQSRSLITREEIYKHFVTADGSNPVDKKYDFKKPFAAEIKQLIDLKYNVNLPDALEGIALTPFDSLPRSALQELGSARKNRSEPEKNADDWLKLLKDSAFERLQQGLYLESLLQDGYLDSLASLNLQEVLEVRTTEEWQIYMQSMDDLLRNPDKFEEMAEPVYQNYINLNKQMTNLVKLKRSQEKVELWTPGIEYILEISGVQLLVKWSDKGTTYAFNGKVSSLDEDDTVPFVEKFRIAGSEANQADLNMTIELKKGTTRSPREQWEAMKRKIQEIPGFRPEPILVGNDATFNLSGEEVA